MNVRSFALSAAVFVMLPLALPSIIQPTLAAASETEDVLIMDDGRELHGRIVSENDDQIVFELIDRKLKIKTTLTLSRDRVTEVRRGVAIPGGAPTKSPAKPADAAPAAAPERPEAPSAAKADAAATADDNLPRIYVLPMKGQMGTDIHPEIYGKAVEDIRQEKPVLIVIEMTSRDIDDLMLSMSSRSEMGLMDFEHYRELVDMFHDGLRDIPQVMWIDDAAGIPSMIALAWKDLYMKSSARLAGLSRVIEETGAQKWDDEDVRAKMTAAFMGHANGFLENGGYSLDLGRAMLLPKYSLSASFEGRKVVWRLDTEGQIIVDSDAKEVVGFSARTAENLGISKGTIDDRDDLLFLLGYREYRLVGDKGRELVEKYRKDWRAAMTESFKDWDEYEKFMGWAEGADTLKYLGQSKQRLESIISAMNRFKPVEIRWRMQRGYDKLRLTVMVEQLKEQIQALKRRGGGRGAPGGGTGGGSGIGGG